MGLMDYLGAIDDYIGYEDDDMLGAPVRRVQQRGGGPFGMPAPRRAAAGGHRLLTQRAQAVAAELQQPEISGAVPQGPLIEPLGFPVFSFVVAGATSVTQVTQPQRALKGGRLTIDIARVNAGGSAGGLITVSAFFIGGHNVLVNPAAPIGAGTFAPNAQQVQLLLPPCGQGTIISMQLTISAAPTVAGDRVDVSVTILGATWGGGGG